MGHLRQAMYGSCQQALTREGRQADGFPRGLHSRPNYPALMASEIETCIAPRGGSDGRAGLDASSTASVGESQKGHGDLLTFVEQEDDIIIVIGSKIRDTPVALKRCPLSRKGATCGPEKVSASTAKASQWGRLWCSWTTYGFGIVLAQSFLPRCPSGVSVRVAVWHGLPPKISSA